MSDTPKTDALAIRAPLYNTAVVPADFAREQERRIAVLIFKAEQVCEWWGRWLSKQPRNDELERAEWSEFFELRNTIERAKQP